MYLHLDFGLIHLSVIIDHLAPSNEYWALEIVW